MVAGSANVLASIVNFWDAWIPQIDRKFPQIDRMSLQENLEFPQIDRCTSEHPRFNRIIHQIDRKSP
jgi:hypothetical protein